MEHELEGRIESAHEEESIFQAKYFKKYRLAIVLTIGAFFLGGSVALGVVGGVLAGIGTQLGMERLKESAPSAYNWILDNPGKVELLSMVAYAGAFGLTLGGILISLVANFTMSLVLDYYAEKEGRVENAPKLTLRYAASCLKDTVKDALPGKKQAAV